MVSVVQWDPRANLDFNLGINVPTGLVYDPIQVVIDIGYDPLSGLGSAYQFDAFQATGAIALVRSRNADGSPADAAAVTYAYMPGATFGQIGTLPNGGGGQRNVHFDDGSILVVGDGTTATATDDLGNNWQLLGGWNGSIHAYGLGGPDTLFGAIFRDRLLGNTGLDHIQAGLGDDSVYGGQGNDTIDGEGGNDLAFGDLGNDQVAGGTGNDTVFGGADDDTLSPGEGDDWGFGGRGADLYDLTGLIGNKWLNGDDGDDWFVLAGNLGNASLWGGAGNEEFSIDSHLGGLYVWGGAGNNSYKVSDLSLGGYFLGGDDRDFFDLSIQHPGFTDAYYELDARGGDDRIAIVGIADGIVIGQFFTGSGRDHLDLSAGFFNENIVYSTGDDADTVHGAANGGIYNLGLGDDWFFGSGGRDQIRITDDWQLGLKYELNDWTLGFDRIRVNAEFFGGIGPIVGYRGDGETGANATHNFFVANDDGYTIDEFLDDWVPRLDFNPLGPFFGMFYNPIADAIELWFILNFALGQTVILMSLPGLLEGDLDQIALSGPSADLQTLSRNHLNGIRRASAALHLAREMEASPGHAPPACAYCGLWGHRLDAGGEAPAQSQVDLRSRL